MSFDQKKQVLDIFTVEASLPLSSFSITTKYADVHQIFLVKNLETMQMEKNSKVIRALVSFVLKLRATGKKRAYSSE